MSTEPNTNPTLQRSAIADLINHWKRVIHKQAFELNEVSEMEAYRKLGYYEGMFDQICMEKKK